jgi:hypothetical protein
MSKDEVFDKLFDKLYKIKDNYGVDKQVEFYDAITNVIKNGFKSKSGPINMKNQKVEWTNKTNLAVYKEGLGVIPIDSLSSLEKSEGKRIPLENFNADFFEYYFIMTKTNPNNPLNGKPGLDKFRLVERSNKYILEMGGGETKTSDELKIEKLNEKLTAFTEQKKLKDEIIAKREEIYSNNLKVDGRDQQEICFDVKSCEKDISDLNELLLKDGIGEDQQNDIRRNIENWKAMLYRYQITKNQMDAEEKKLTDDAVLKNTTKKLNDALAAAKSNAGFNIEDKEIDGEKYISFSVKEYLERMIPAFQ